MPVGDETPRYNITDADLAHLHSDLTASIRSTLSKDIRQHVEKHVDEVHYYCTFIYVCIYMYVYLYSHTCTLVQYAGFHSPPWICKLLNFVETIFADAINDMPNGLLCEHFHVLNFQGWRSILENAKNFHLENLALYSIRVHIYSIIIYVVYICTT